MHKTGARRLIAVSAAAAFIPEDPDKSWIAKQTQPRIFARTFADVRRMERLVKDTGPPGQAGQRSGQGRVPGAGRLPAARRRQDRPR
jgi:hypothetical protein